MPAGHAVHAVAPGSGLYVPAPQGWQNEGADAPAAGLYLPAAHGSHAVLAMAPKDVEYLPAVQLVHAGALPVLKVPCAIARK